MHIRHKAAGTSKLHVTVKQVAPVNPRQMWQVGGGWKHFQESNCTRKVCY